MRAHHVPMPISLMLFVFVSCLAGAQIQVCRSASGEYIYTDVKCPPDVTQRSAYDPPAAMIYPAPPIYKQPHKPRHKPRPNTPRHNPSAARAERRAQCAQVASALDSIRAKRRSGYSINEANALDEQEQHLKAQRRKHC